MRRLPLAASAIQRAGLQCKQQQVADAMQRIAKVPCPPISPILGSENIWEYRNKMEYTFSNRRWLTYEQLNSGLDFPDRDGAGFHIPGAFDKVLDINRCHLQDDFSNQLRKFIKAYGIEHGYSFYDLRANAGLLRTLMVRMTTTGQIMALMAFGEDNPEKIKQLLDAVRSEFPQITSLLYVINLKVNDTITDQTILTHSGADYIEEEMEGLKFRIGPKSFYQTNSRQAYNLYKVARDFAALTGDEPGIRPIHRHRHHSQLCEQARTQGDRHRIRARSHRGCQNQLADQRH